MVQRTPVSTLVPKEAGQKRSAFRSIIWTALPAWAKAGLAGSFISGTRTRDINGGRAVGILTDAELLLGLSRHLSAYASGPDRAALAEIEFVGWSYDLAFRLRGSTTSPAERVKAIGIDIGLSSRNLREVITLLESMGWLTVQRDEQGSAVFVNESLPAAADLVAAAPQLLNIANVGPLERAALALLRATTIQPMLREDALAAADSAAGGDAAASEAAVRHLSAVGLVRVATVDMDRDVLYNPNVWTQGQSIAEAALKAADANATREVRALLEELAENPGLPEAKVQSTEVRWVRFAVAQGLVQRSVIQTTEGGEQGFLFTPHLARDPFGGTAGDASGHVRQLVGSMIYATTFAKYRLHSPDVFLGALLRNGVAGNTESIGTDYPMLEKAGIVRVVPGTGSRFRLELLQADIAEDALRLLSSSVMPGGATGDAAALRAQRNYIHVERARARLALSANSDEAEEARLIASLRDVTKRRAMGGQGW